jgi:RNA polymerase sigma-70 factor (ECF subfamily)
MDPDITGLLSAASTGDADAAAQLMPLIYDHLHRRASALMQRESPNHTLQPTVLVHDAFLKLVRQERAHFRDRNHFFAVAAQTMRRILVDHARGRMRLKRGGEDVKVSLDEAHGISVESDTDVLALDAALEKLATIDPRQARIVELRFFAGMSVEEVAAILDTSKRTVESEWTMISAWLRRELSSE